MRVLDHTSHACLTLAEVASFPHWLYHFAISLPPVIFQQWYFIAGMKVPAVLYPTQELDIISLFNRGYVVVTHYGFNLHHPLSDVEHLCESSVPLLSRSESLRPHGLQHARPPCPSPTPGACSDSCPSSQWCHPTISSSVIPFSSCPQSFPASGSFPVSQFFPSGGQRIGVSASASVLPMNTQDWSPLGLSGLIACIGHSCLLWRLFTFSTNFLLVCLLVIHGSFHAMDVSLIYVLWVYSPRM